MQSLIKCHQILLLLTSFTICSSVFGHDLSGANADFLRHLNGVGVAPMMYLGAKHMITGIDHLLYLLAIVFFLQKTRDILIFATFFTIGHSITLSLGVLFQLTISTWLVDAIIGLSIVYKSFENQGGFKYILPVKINPLVAVFTFGLFHGLGLAGKIQEIGLSENGIAKNILSFNIGVEIGQFLALSVAIMLFLIWQKRDFFAQQAFAVNTFIMFCGFTLAGYHLVGYAL